MNSRQHFVQAVCEVHRYEVHDHKTDGVTLHGLDEDDRKAVWTAFAKSIVAAVAKDRSLCIRGVEHMDVRIFLMILSFIGCIHISHHVQLWSL